MKLDTLVVGAISFVSFCAGGGLAYHLTVKALDKKYNERMETELERTRQFYERTSKPADMQTPAAAAAALGISGDEALENAAEALLRYKGDVRVHEVSLDAEPNPFVEAAGIDGLKVGEPIERNAFEDAEDIGFSERNPDGPYKITRIEFAANEEEYDQLEATYYAGDKILTDDQDGIINDVDGVIGKANLELFDEDGILYVCNERLKAVYAVNKMETQYAHHVAGLQHSDSTYERMRPARRSADE